MPLVEIGSTRRVLQRSRLSTPGPLVQLKEMGYDDDGDSIAELDWRKARILPVPFLQPLSSLLERQR
jgi:hypothetical protein